MIDTLGTLSEPVSQGLYRDILTGILTGAYPAKSTLPTESRLARDYGVSRSVVRSALERLKQEGLVRALQGSGTVVEQCAQPDLAALQKFTKLPVQQDCYACRLAIEPEVVACLANTQSRAANEYLRDQQRNLEAQVNSVSKIGIEEAAIDAEFHVRLAELSGNVFFASIMASLRPHMLFSMNNKKILTRQALGQHIILSHMEHCEIIKAILDRDDEVARSAMRTHIANAQDRVL